MRPLPIVAIMYDFDRTLCTKDMQDYSFIPSLGMTEREFWDFTNEIWKREQMDSVLAYMYAMVKTSAERGIPLLREKLVSMGKNVEFFEGVEEWFDRINAFGAANGVQIEHYVISSGMKEIIEGTSISQSFRCIFACEFLYDENGGAVWPKTDVNYTNKTQFVYRINKGVLDISNDLDLNRSMPDDSKRVPFTDSKVEDLLQKDRVDFIYPADYSEGTGLDLTVKHIIRKMAVCDILERENSRQKRDIQTR